MDDLRLEYLRLTDLKPDPRNARTHSKKQIAQIAASISGTTFANPILIDEDGVIIAGHGRKLAAESLKLETVPTVRVSGLSEPQKRALRIADNKIALNAGWDLDLLKVELADIELGGLDLDLTGFTVGEIDSLRGDLADPDDEVAPGVAEQAVGRAGDVWMLGPHRVACGDLRDEALMDRLMAGRQVDAAFLDPPYNVPIKGHVGGKGAIKHREFAVASGEMTPAQFTAFLEHMAKACTRVSRDGAVHFICMDHRHVDELLAGCGAVYGARLNIAVWNKSNAGMGSLYRSKHELVFVYRVGQAPHLNNVELGRHGRNRTNVWDYASVNTVGGSRRHDLQLHPTVKPTGLVADAIKDVTRQGDLVLDAFLGSGTTLIAAERTGRQFVGLDIDPLYVDVALARWSAMTGVQPVLAESGETFTQVRARRMEER